MKFRDLNDYEKTEVEAAWDEYLAAATKPNATAAETTKAWNVYQAVLRTLGVIASLLGYRVRVHDPRDTDPRPNQMAH